MVLACVLAALLPAAHLASAASYTLDTYKGGVTSQDLQRIANQGHEAPEFDAHGHWFARGFHVGNSKNLDFLIDTGSSDCLIGSYYYHKGASGHYTGKNFSIVYYPDPQQNTVHGKIYQDEMTFAQLSVQKQDIGIFPQNKTGAQGGIIGFSGLPKSSLHKPGWFNNLCNQKALDQCRFGLAYGTNKTGKQVIGSVDHTLFKGELTTAPRANVPGWSVMGDVTIGGKVVDMDAALVTDSGTDRIFGPVAKIRPIFDLLGYKYTFDPGNPKHPKGHPSSLKAEFPCDTTLQLGFSIPSAKVYSTAKKQGKAVSKPKVFTIGQSYWGPPLANGNCTSILWGSDQFSKGFKFGSNGWLVGQAFHEGHYIDHNLEGHSMAFADLI